MYMDNNDSLWISCEGGLFIGSLEDLKQGNYEIRARNLFKVLDLPERDVLNINSNRFGSIWLKTASEILQVISTDQPAIIFNQETGLMNNSILSTLVDAEDNVWVGYRGGLQKLPNKKGLRNFYPGIINSYIYSLLCDKNNHLWITSNNGIYIFNNKLVNLDNILLNHEQKTLIGILPDKNILLVTAGSLTVIDPDNLAVIRNRKLSQRLEDTDKLFISSKGEIFISGGTWGGVYYFPEFSAEPVMLRDKTTLNVYGFIEIDGRILGGNSDGIFEFKNDSISNLNKINCNVWSLSADEQKIWLGTDRGLAFIQNNNYGNVQYVISESGTIIKSILAAKNKNYLWLGTNKGLIYFNKETGVSEIVVDSKDGLQGDEITPAGLFLDESGILWIGTYHGLSNFNLRARSREIYTPECLIESIYLNGERIDIKSGKLFRYNENNIVFEIAALSYNSEEYIEYEFYLRGSSNSYSSYNKGKEYKAFYNNLPPGEYEFIYRAKGKNNVWGYAHNFNFNIRKAWYNTLVFRILVILFVFISGWILYKLRIRSIEAQKSKLELLVKERTRALEDANAEIEAQRDLATSQRDQISAQKKEITDSLNYARKIQKSLLPSDRILKSILPEHFILFKPRDIVSGDFYWAAEKSGRIYLCAADCTGHGVPGAFMSVLGISLLAEIISQEELLGPEEILNRLRKSLIKSMNQEGQSGEPKDGIDMSMIIFDKNHTELSFSGAINSMYLIRDMELQEVKGDNLPVGINENMAGFTRHSFSLKRGDSFYIFSDGYADQFGGPKAKKFMYSNFKSLLMTIQPKSMREQGKILDETFEVWKGDINQIDDIVVIGIRF
jgi:serine phosphatase RsbU (regulator of sigma subunit)/ligand-binding sensor domain-containing protein